jgi:hypothetical protein
MLPSCVKNIHAFKWHRFLSRESALLLKGDDGSQTTVLEKDRSG